jgi:hypothetical protein
MRAEHLPAQYTGDLLSRPVTASFAMAEYRVMMRRGWTCVLVHGGRNVGMGCQVAVGIEIRREYPRSVFQISDQPVVLLAASELPVGDSFLHVRVTFEVELFVK